MQDFLVYEKSTHGLHKEPSQHKGDKHILVAQLRLIHMLSTNSGLAATHSYGTG